MNNIKKIIYELVDKDKELNKVDKNAVLRLHNEGVRNIDISRELGCAKSSITYILKNNLVK